MDQGVQLLLEKWQTKALRTVMERMDTGSKSENEEDSDDDGEWTPQRDEVHEDEEDIFISKKRKNVKNSSIKSKKPKIQKVISKPTNDLTCKKCSTESCFITSTTVMTSLRLSQCL